MKFRCEDCGEMILSAKARFCPMCGKGIEAVMEPPTGSIKEKVLMMYHTGYSLRKISMDLSINLLTTVDIISKEWEQIREIPPFVQTEYEEALLSVIPDGKIAFLKPIKEAVSEDCTYATIAYYVRQKQREALRKRNKEIYRRKLRMHELIELQAPIGQIKAETGLQDYDIERGILGHIADNPDRKWRYIQTEYENEILQAVSLIGAGHSLKVFKDRLLEDCTYLTIKEIFRKHGLRYVNGKFLEAA